LQQLDQMKSEFVSLVSHEFRAPLTNMRGALELMGDTCPAVNPTCTRMIGIVEEQASRLGRMVEDVLNVSRIEAGGLVLTFQAVDFNAARDQVLAEFAARDQPHRFRTAEGPSGLRLWADPDRLHEILTNLVDNAVKYSPHGTEILIGGEAREQTGVISVADSGPGIPPQELSQIFDKFHRIDTGDSKETYGYGLGLYLCRRLVEAMEGRIWVESGQGQGSMFRFELPLAPEGAAVGPVG
jgi:signal transduction histidine kinase